MGLTRRQWALALLLAVVLAAFGASVSGGGSPASAEPHDGALTAYESDPAALAPTRALGVTERPAPPTEYAVAPPHPAPPAPFVHRRSPAAHESVPPQKRRAPSTGDRAPPSH
jgi:hypothetical protein